MPTLPANFTLLQVVPELNAGGVERTTLDISRAVVAAGGRSLVVSQGGRLEAELEAGGGELQRLPVASKNPVTILANAGRIAGLIRRENVSLVHARSRAPAVSAWLAARRTGIPFVATYHGVYNARSPLKRWYNSIMTRGALVIANSDYTRRHVIAEHGVEPARVIAVDRGTDLTRFDPAAVDRDRVQAMRRAWGLADGDGRTVFLLAGRLTRWKGQLALVEAAARLKAAGRDDFLVVLMGDDQGRSAFRAELEAAIIAAGLGDHVRIAPHGSDMPAAWLAADVAAVPSLDPEAFGRTAVEPQIMGRPVIASAHGAPCDTVLDGQTGWLAAPGDADAWAVAMAAALDAGPQGRAVRGATAAARARSLYSLETMIAGTFDVYRRLLGPARP